ncbi:sporulation protein YunB [Effusibacillus pohliae]|uniref:sporulation protein YunB n=1 Tax=Effusibacillus pohliae TaxID=232270 RepID=UPI0003608514|nr:sporulation protein YunB [Effusibacillus pohliae]
MRLRKPVKRWKVVVATGMLLLIGIVIQTLLFLEYNLQPTFVQIAENYTRKIATEAINDAITKKVAEETDYEQIVQFYKDDRGNIRSAVFNMVEANRIKAQTTNRVQSVLKVLEEQEIKLPVGQAFHSTILATFGPAVPIKIVPMGTAKSDLVPASETLGINQTKHSLTLNIHVQVNVVIPFVTRPVDIETQIPVASVVMVGDVPTYFLDAKGVPFVPSGMAPVPSPSSK